MSIKKLLLLSAASMVAAGGVAFAGGPDHMPAQQESVFHPGLYMDLHGGYIFQDWAHYITNTTTIWSQQDGMTNSKGGFAGGVDIGLQILHNIGVEVGGFYLPRVKGQANSADSFNSRGCGGANPTCTDADQYNWLVYAGAKFSVPMPYLDGFDLFAKVGAGWRAMSNTNQVVAGRGGMHSYWRPVFGAGLEYELMQTGFKFGAQWMHIPGNNSGDDLAANTPSVNHSNSKKFGGRNPTANMVTGSIGYIFDF